ncbi:MAG TPA: hypothetical protein GX513_00055 [Firmicutes bacterium]|nr:hypothetical protein [Bacillota bacterium]
MRRQISWLVRSEVGTIEYGPELVGVVAGIGALWIASGSVLALSCLWAGGCGCAKPDMRDSGEAQAAGLAREALWGANSSQEEQFERARLLAKEIACAVALAEGRVDDLLRAFPGHFDLVVRLRPGC